MFRTLTPIISILLAAGLFFFYTQPTFTEIKEIQDETDEYGEAVAKAAEFNQLLNSLISKRNSFSARELERLEALVPDEVNEMRLLVDLQAMANRHNMLFGNIEVAEETSKVPEDVAATESTGGTTVTLDDFRSTDISFGLIGDYEQFRAMLREMERSLTMLEVVNLNVTAPAEGDLMQFSVTTRTNALKSRIQ